MNRVCFFLTVKSKKYIFLKFCVTFYDAYIHLVDNLKSPATSPDALKVIVSLAK